MPDLQKYLTRSELAADLKITTKTLDRWRLDHDMPSLKLSSRCIRFRMWEVEKWMNSKGKR